MLDSAFDQLSDDQLNQLADAFPLITILVGEVDDELDADEMNWGIELTNKRSFSHYPTLRPLYELTHSRFVERINALRGTMSNDIAVRTDDIFERIEELNPIMAKLDPAVGATLYKSMLSFAGHIARSSGGFMRFFSVSGEEKAVMSLPTLHPIEGLVETDEADEAHEEEAQ
jgi:hypothetical protein